MYSYENRIRAVKRYIKCGKRARPTIRQLHCPAKNSLQGWYQEHEKDRDLRVGCARAMQKHSVQQLQMAVKHYLEHDHCIVLILNALGYPRSKKCWFSISDEE